MSYQTGYLLLYLLLAAILAFVLTYRVIDRRSSQEDTEPADVILVLGSAVWPNELPSPSLRARTERAIELYQAGRAPYLLLSGGLGRYPPEEAEVMSRLAREAGVPEEALFLDKEAHSTWESLENASGILEQEGWSSLIVVSDPFHMERSLQMARDLGLEAYGSPALHSPTYTVLARRVFYTSREVFALWWYVARRTLHVL